MSPSLTLHIDSNFYSPYAMFAYIALREKNLPFTLVPVDLNAGAQHSDAYRQRSLTSRVPTLEHDGFALSESSAIIEYLEDSFPAPSHAAVLPNERHARARARQLLAWLGSDLLALRSERPTVVIFQARSEAPLSAACQADADKLLAVADALLEPGTDHLFGHWCIADTALALMLNRLVANGDPVPENVRTFVANQWQRPSVQAWVAKDGKRA